MKIVVIGGSGLIGASYVGTPVDDRTLTPGANPRLGPTRFQEWLERSAPRA